MFFNVEHCFLEKKQADAFESPKKQPNRIVGLLLVFLTLFFTFHQPKPELPFGVETSSLGSTVPFKAPALEANHAVKFVSRSQGAFKLSNGSDDDELVGSQLNGWAKARAGLNLFKPYSVYGAVSNFHFRRFYLSKTQPRAPPVDLT